MKFCDRCKYTFNLWYFIPFRGKKLSDACYMCRIRKADGLRETNRRFNKVKKPKGQRTIVEKVRLFIRKMDEQEDDRQNAEYDSDYGDEFSDHHKKCHMQEFLCQSC